MYSKSLEIDIRVHGDSHPSVSASCSNMGVVLSNLGKYQEALTCIRNRSK
jgi:hypothetical protein